MPDRHKISCHGVAAAICCIGFATQGVCDGPTYFADVAPILRKHCVACHDDASRDDLQTSGGLSLEGPEAILGAHSGKLIVAGSATRSGLYRRLVHSDAEKRMPKDDLPLADESVNTIRRWIEAGAPLGSPTSKPNDAKPKTRTRHSMPRRPVLLDATIAGSPLSGMPNGRIQASALIGPLSPVTALAHSPDGQWLAVGRRGVVEFWSISKAMMATSVLTALPDVLAMAFSPDAKKLWIAGGEPGVGGGIAGISIPDFRLESKWHSSGDVCSAFAIAKSGDLIAVVGFDRMLRIFDAQGILVKETKAHGDVANCVAFSPDDRWLVTGGKDTAVKLWDAKTLSPIRAFGGHNKEVMAVSFSPNGSRIYSTGAEPEIRVWDAARVGRPTVQAGPGVATHQLSWDASRSKFASVGADRQVHIWSADAKRLVSSRPTADVLYAVSFAPDGKTVVAGGWDGVVRIWRSNGGDAQASLVAASSDQGKSAWLAFTSAGYFSASSEMIGLAAIRSGKTTRPFAECRGALESPGKVAACLTGHNTPSGK